MKTTSVLVPTHTTAMPVDRGGYDPPIHIMDSVTPLDRKHERLRAYHALCDKWKEIENPTPSDECWEVRKILERREVTEDTGGNKRFIQDPI